MRSTALLRAKSGKGSNIRLAWISRERRADATGKRLVALEIGHARDAKIIAELARGHLHRPRGGRGARRGLREGGRAAVWKVTLPSTFLHDLVDMAVQHGHRAELFQN